MIPWFTNNQFNVFRTFIKRSIVWMNAKVTERFTFSNYRWRSCMIHPKSDHSETGLYNSGVRDRSIHYFIDSIQTKKYDFRTIHFYLFSSSQTIHLCNFFVHELFIKIFKSTVNNFLQNVIVCERINMYREWFIEFLRIVVSNKVGVFEQNDSFFLTVHFYNFFVHK